MWYDGLNNKSLWKIFDSVSKIPRESGNEEGIRNFLISWASSHNLRSLTDSMGNVVIKVPATEGYEDYPMLALQGHMDMVAQKTKDSSHDFLKDPIEIYVKDGFIRAKDTTLGADNGIAIAMALDIFSDKNAKHGPLEGIFTVSEETGMDGAFSIDPSIVESRRLINLDSESEGVICIGCAGGKEVFAAKALEWEKARGKALRITVTGGLGGHSGEEIGKERANAIKIMGRLLSKLRKFGLCSINGGTRHNVIPSQAEAVIVIVVPDEKEVLSEIDFLRSTLSDEFKDSDPGLEIFSTEVPTPEKSLTPEISRDIAGLLYVSPHGPFAMNTALKTVETSSNLAIVSMDDEKIFIDYSVRSTVESKKESLVEVIETLAEKFGFATLTSEGYPAWEPSTDPSFRDEVVSAYEKISGTKPKLTVIHAGLECGILNSRFPGMESLSLGPDLFGVHSVNEALNAESAERVLSILKEMLPLLK